MERNVLHGLKIPQDQQGEALLEVSACYKGAVPNAKLKKPEEAPQFTIELTAGKKLKGNAYRRSYCSEFQYSY